MSPEVTPPAVSRRGLRIAGAALVLAAAAIITMGIATRKMADARLNAWTESQAVPTVSVAKPDTKGRRATIELPGRLEALSQAQIFARVSGYIKEWKVDIGIPVKTGQVLAEIDAPDLDQQIMQARADVATAEANLVLAKANLERGQSLISSVAITRRELDQRQAEFASREAMVKAAQANVERLLVMERYKRIVAPFDGLVSARATDIGALINAGAGGGPALFVISDTSKLRLYVNAPQSYVPSIRMGTKAQITVPEFPGRTFTAVVEASSRAVDPASGTTRMLLIVDNTGGELMTGAFATVNLELPPPDNAINVPAAALIFDQNGLRVATVGSDGRVLLKTVTISRDLGKEVEIASGLTADDHVIQSPPDGIGSGDLVRIMGAEPERAGALPGKPRG